MSEKNLRNKVFIVTGELSGDKTAAWFVKKLVGQGDKAYFEAVGGDFLAACGVKLYERFEELNVVGIIEILRHLIFILRFMHTLIDHIKAGGFEEVVLVDFPGFNLRLAKKLKNQVPGIKITYLAPPQLWCWGAWRVKKLKKYCDKVIVLYPFEVEWYAQRGVNAMWMGNPSYDETMPYFEQTKKKEDIIALIPGSRVAEVKRFMPILAEVVKFFLERYPNVKFVIPAAESLSSDFLKSEIVGAGLRLDKIQILQSQILQSNDEKFKVIEKCCLAITKPGTVTLELALLGVPAVVFFKISWLTYFIGRVFVRVRFMALPNLLLGTQVYKECIQQDCKSKIIFDYSRKIYQGFIEGSQEYGKTLESLKLVRKLFGWGLLVKR